LKNIFTNIVQQSPFRTQNEPHNPHFRGVCARFAAISPHPDAPYPSRVFGKQQIGLLEVPAHTAKIENQCVLELAARTGSKGFRLRLHPGKGVFHSCSNPPKFTIALLLGRTQRVVAMCLVQNSIKPSKLPGHDLDAIIGVGFILKQRPGLEIRQILGIQAVVIIGRAEDAFVDQFAFHIHPNVAFVSKVVAILLFTRPRIGVPLRIVLEGFRLPVFFFDGPVGRLHHGRINDTALANKQLLFIELAVYLFKQTIAQPGFCQFILEFPEAGEVRSLVSQGKPNKVLKTQAVIELFFQLGITQPVKVLQKQRFDHHHWVVSGATAFITSTLIEFTGDPYQRLPVNHRFHLGKKGGCSCILLFRVEELVGEGALGVFLDHNWTICYWYLYSYKIQKHEIK